MIYFIQSNNYVKIGYTSNMKNRYKKYVTENPDPIKIIGTCKGGFDTEKKIHKEFKQWHYRGEWFHLNEQVRLKIAEIIKENRDTEEPIKKRFKRNRDVHLKVLNLLKEYASATGYVDISYYVKLIIMEKLEITQGVLTRHISKLLKHKRLTKIETLYYIV